jgi:hypothetical protein
MGHVKSTTRPRDDAAAAKGEGRDSAGSAERPESSGASDAGSHNCAQGDFDEGPHTHNYYYGHSTVIVSRVRKMIDRGYFAIGDACVPGEETIPEPDSDKAIVFEEFFTTGLRMPPHPVFMDILLNFQMQLHQLTPNAIGQLSKYIWAVVSFGGVLSVDSFTKRYELYY